ncbi:amine acid ABC transporter, permease protein, 3-TM region, His/Glu/Gln/Arg/opine family [Desulfosporosinus orientis DSM 765]|uniref:Amine acid ABC transporter, permease protein, 3-TM region, His/Glu/Gln/Arg/opine family n=1 Tax=Desulfosporosinus orientis (strain ATCC 19365 / DSM 765 / NCIMB 8382 / VKM B-1628 / Singapore I) TaxID=768706 RepID=G7WE61_DESOD|nr:amino acid ABC transporter permease [Desulfosporosinus orientis]AET70037.1 amine acid ABC transporter, permease protein, 3-TM region, His/Glu/Gln/Arg/opine family [Desulfosporosinus orientis DSM 765]
MDLDFSIIVKYLPFLLQGAALTIELAVLGIAFGIIIGLIAAILKISHTPLKYIAHFYIWLIRGTPLLVQLFLIYFGLPQLGITLNAFASSILGLGINSGAYIAEVFRGGIEAIPKGQTEASLSLGMGKFLTMRRIIFPQALRISIPSLGNQFIISLKDSSLCSVITMSELLQTSQRFASVTFGSLEFYTTAALLYLLMTTVISAALRSLEWRLSKENRTRAC